MGSGLARAVTRGRRIGGVSGDDGDVALRRAQQLHRVALRDLLGTGDAAKIADEPQITLEADGPTELILADVAV